MEIRGLLQRYADRIESLLREEIPPEAVEFLSDGVWYQFSSGGKRLRPALCLLTCEQLGGSAERAVPFALAAEILHNVLLIHDDIEDGDVMRRDRQTLWHRFGLPNALNVSDYLISNAYRILLRSDLEPRTIVRLADIYSMTFERTVEGQALDINLRGCDSLTVARYHQIVQLKTAYYLTFNLVGGAVIAGIGDDVIEQLWELGRRLGPAFQIRDDMIDLTEGKGRGGEVGCDIREGKPSIFFAHALEALPAGDPRRAALVAAIVKPREETGPDDVQRVMDLYREVGAFGFADAECARLVEAAYQVIERLPLAEDGKELFRAIGRFMIDRRS